MHNNFCKNNKTGFKQKEIMLENNLQLLDDLKIKGKDLKN